MLPFAELMLSDAGKLDVGQSSGAPLPAVAVWRAPSRPRAAPRTLLWLIAGAAVLLVALIPYDANVSAWIAGLAEDGNPLRRVFKLPAHLFKWYSAFALGVVLFLQVDWRRRLVAYVATIACTIAVLHALKFLVGRARPDLQAGPWMFLPFGDASAGFDAFPSGHTVSAILLVVLAFHYLRPLGWALLPLGVLASLVRIIQLRHFVTDVVAGVLLVLVAVYVARRVFGDAAFAPLGPWRRFQRRSEFIFAQASE
jgi:membrane-associated phospholipid phosphatase